jgi:hypothetical protein
MKIYAGVEYSAMCYSILGRDKCQLQAPTAVLEENYILAYCMPLDGNSYAAWNQMVLWQVKS